MRWGCEVGFCCDLFPSSCFQIPSQSFPVNEVFSGSATYSSLGVAGAEEEGSRKKRSKDREEIALIVFWQVKCMC